MLRLLYQQKWSLLLLLTIAFGCRKQEGTGGLATIKGRVFAYNIDKNGTVTDSGYMADVRVFISYGTNTWTDNDVRSSFDGSFAFQWLQPGNYKVWAISKCDTCNLGQRSVIREITIKDKKETVTTPDLVIYF